MDAQGCSARTDRRSRIAQPSSVTPPRVRRAHNTAENMCVAGIIYVGLDRSGVSGLEFSNPLNESGVSMGLKSVGVLSGRRFCLALVRGALLAILTRGAFAGQLQGLDQAVVPVRGQDVEELNNAMGQALKQVLVKITGSRSVGDREVTRELIGQAVGLVQEYRYEVPAAGATGGQTAGRLLLVRFDSHALHQALRDRGLPVWGATRPTLLLWLGVEQEGQRRFFQPETRS